MDPGLTSLESITRFIFRKEDEQILKYVEDEGELVEPVSYAPILPMILVNGTIGVGYGYSTTVPSYNPMAVVDNLINLIKGIDLEKMTPEYFGFTGEVKKVKNSSKNKKSKYFTYKMTGTCEVLDEDTVLITEIPVIGHKASITKYIKFLESKIVTKDDKKKTKKKKGNEQYLVSVKNGCGNNSINIRVKFAGNTLQKLYTEGKEAIEKALRLSTTIRTSNFHLYDEFGRLTKYEDTDQIFNEFYKYRYKMYKKRKVHILAKLFNEMNISKYKAKFVKEIVDKTFVISKWLTLIAIDLIFIS